jgi:hypothetical protein
MKKLPIPLIFIFFAFNSFAQDFLIDVEHFVWSDSLPTFVPTEQDQKSATIIVSMDKITEYKWDKKGENIERFYLSHTLKYINDDKSIEDNNKIYVSTYDEQNLLYIRTRVINNGKIVFEASQKDFIEIEEEGHKYNQIALKQLTKGSLVETIIGYKLETYLYSEEFFQTNHPVKKGRYILISPKELKFNSKVYNGMDTLTDSVYENRRFSYVTFSNVLPIDAEESYSLVNANKLRVEYVYSQHMVTNYKYQKWPEMGRLFFDRMNKNYDKNQKDLDKILKKINLKQYATEKEKIFAIENFVKQNIGSEENAPEVETYAEVLKMKYTYPFKLNQILFQLYRKAEINCEIVLTCAKDYKRFDPNFDSWAYLKNVLFYFPETKQYMDPQASIFRLGRVNSDYLGQSGLFIKTISIGDMVSASASVKYIPANDPQSSSDFENYTVTLSNDLSSTTLNYNRKMYGYGDMGYRGLYYLFEEEKRKELIEELVKGIAKESTVSKIDVQNFNITEFKTLETPFEVSAQLTSNHYIETAGEDKVLLKVGELIGQQAEMYQEEKRTNPVDISYAHSYNRTLTIIIPKGYHIKGLDKLNINHTFNNTSDKPSFGFVSSYTLEGDKLIITCKEYYNDLSYSVAQFEDFKRVINDAADFNKISILIEKDS